MPSHRDLWRAGCGESRTSGSGARCREIDRPTRPDTTPGTDAYWSHGGTTDLDNLILLCGEHHRALHDGCFTITAHGEQRFTFHHPSGRCVDYAPTLTGNADDITRRYHHVEPDAITANWSGESLDVSFATDVLLRNWELDARRKQKLAA